MSNKLKKLFGWLDFGGSALSSVANVISTALTNKSNQRIAAAQNAMQIAENEKAYQRSKATNQVNLMRDAGMSKAGALNALNGGGSYQPAPITSIPNQAPQMDLSSAFDGLIQIGENAKQRKMQEEALDKQIAAAKEQQQAQFEENARQREHDLEIQSREHINTNRNADNRLDFDRKVFEEQLPKLRAEINQIVQNTENLKKIGKGNDLDNIRKDLENKNYPTLAKIANAQAWQSIQYTAMKMAHENANHMNQQERETLELEFYRAVMDSGISLQNAQNELQAYLANQETNLYKDGIVGSFIGALAYAMDKLIPKFASLK